MSVCSIVVIVAFFAVLVLFLSPISIAMMLALAHVRKS
jgi:hypothetical protein